ncbi:hypothetical protein AB0J83_34915 [Actinoplanes sp. NPDC049596]|uniref:hypothetical protein n=1 Tax=unclassified Actinoplanes TaxID=2626549 RepID=UPI003447014C
MIWARGAGLIVGLIVVVVGLGGSGRDAATGNYDVTAESFAVWRIGDVVWVKLTRMPRSDCSFKGVSPRQPRVKEGHFTAEMDQAGRLVRVSQGIEESPDDFCVDRILGLRPSGERGAAARG